MVARGHVEERARLGLADMDEIAGIGLRVDRLVLALRGAEAVAHDLGGAVVGVHRHVPEALRVRRPDRLAGGRLDPVVAVEAGGDVAHPDRVEFRALGVGAPGQPAVVVGMDRGGDLEEGKPLALPVAVDQDGLVRVRPGLGHVGRGRRPPADQRVLPALAVAGVVGEGPVRLRDAALILLDPPAHLGDEPLAQRRGPGERRFGEGVLGLEVGGDVVRQGGRVLEDRLPVLGLQPRVGIGDLLPVDAEAPRPNLGDRRAGGLSEQAVADLRHRVSRRVPSRSGEGMCPAGRRDARWCAAGRRDARRLPRRPHPGRSTGRSRAIGRDGLGPIGGQGARGRGNPAGRRIGIARSALRPWARIAAPIPEALSIVRRVRSSGDCCGRY